MKDIKEMRPMERHRYITSNSKKCQCCKKVKKLSSFWVKETNEIQEDCNVCSKKKYEKEVLELVLNVMKKEGEI